MKVLQINSVCGIGSTGRIATELHKDLIDKGHESYIAYGRGEPINCENAIKIGTKFDNFTHLFATRLFDRHGFGSVAATKDFIRWVEDLDPDIIHLHNVHGYYLNIETLFNYLKHSEKPVVWTLHDCWSFTGHCAYFTYAQCDKWKVGCHDCSQKKSYPASLFLDGSKRNYTIKKDLFANLENISIVTPSQWLADLVGNSYLSKIYTRKINNGIDIEIFRPVGSTFVREKYKLGHGFLILGVANIWNYRKGLEYFIRLSKILPDNFQIVIVGLDDKQITSLPSNIIGIKQTSNIDELVQLYSLADVFVNPTMEDNFPTVNIEALACGTPVITFNTGGSPESIKDNCGYVVEKGNVDGLKKYINIVRQAGKNSYSQQCIRSVRDNFSKNDRIKEYLDLYHKVIKS